MRRYDADVDLRTAHDVRTLAACPCGGFGHKANMIARDGKWYHGRCFISAFGIQSLLDLPDEQVTGLTLGDIGWQAMLRLLDAVKRDA